ncbi:MAG: ATPase, T2SS/T4P/T4SS family [Planctomycetota bacterium]|nr:ATPase, T2SS/T4P/T4SS family [Planctomycetota bacterium]
MPDLTIQATAILADAPILMSILKPLLLIATFVAYTRYVARLEADARMYTLPILGWNLGYIGAALVSLVLIVFIPWFFVGWLLAVMILAGTMFAYWKFRDARLPENRRFRFGGEKLAKAMAARKQAAADRAASAQFTRADGSKEPVPQKEDPTLGIYLTVEQMMLAPLSVRATRIDLASTQAGVATSMLVDGVRTKGEPMPPDVGNAAIDMIKRLAGLDVNDRRRRQTGAFTVTSAAGSSRLTVTSIGSSSGQSLRVEFDREERFGKAIDSIGLAPSQLEALRTLEDPGKRVGVVIVSAPPGQGLTTLGFSLVSRHDAYTSNIKTLERELVYRVEGVEHKAFAPEPGVDDYGAALTKIIRRDPDVVLAADISEPGSAKAATLMGLERPLVYVLVPAESMAAAVATWIQAVGDPKTATKCLSAVVHQRLIRQLCPNCKSPFTPAPEQAKKLGIPTGKQVELFRPSGKIQVKNRIEDCPVCQGSAYFGQIGIFEVLMVDKDARQMLAENDFRGAYARAVRDTKMTQLQEAALLKVREGLTSLEEVQRVFAPKQAAAAKPSAGGATAPPPPPAPTKG